MGRCCKSWNQDFCNAFLILYALIWRIIHAILFHVYFNWKFLVFCRICSDVLATITVCIINCIQHVTFDMILSSKLHYTTSNLRTIVATGNLWHFCSYNLREFEEKKSLTFRAHLKKGNLAFVITHSFIILFLWTFIVIFLVSRGSLQFM